MKMSLEEYEILGIIGDITSSIYKVQNKITKSVFQWQAIDYSIMNDSEKLNLLKRLNERKSITHPNFLKFYNYVEHKDSKILYVSTELCEIGNLKNLIQACLKNDEGLREELIVRIIYQICFTMKTSPTIIKSLKLEEIYLDEEYNVKFFNFTYHSHQKDEDLIEQLKNVILHLYTLKYETSLPHDIGSYGINYSKEFCLLLKTLSQMDFSENQYIDAILCHPTVLLISSKWSKDKCFFKKKQDEMKSTPEIIDNDSSSTEYAQKVQKLRKWEVSLKIKESKLQQKEISLTNREKRLNLMERTVKEKLAQAELYLRRCKDTKSASSGSSKGSSKTSKSLEENLDSSFPGDCGDSVIICTSKKLNVSKIVKPPTFTRTLSERRVRFKGHSPLKEAVRFKGHSPLKEVVRFKGHSPLKDIDYNRRKKPVLKEYTLHEQFPKGHKMLGIISEQNSEKSNSSDSIDKENIHKSRKLFPTNNVEYKKNKNFIESEVGCRPISWTEESKKQAFDLLRVMNGAISDEIKHTYL